jgi:hypothetical protein
MWSRSDARPSDVVESGPEWSEWRTAVQSEESKETFAMQDVRNKAPASGDAEEITRLSEWTWAAASWLWEISIFCFDVGIVVSMQLFLESIGKKKWLGSAAQTRTRAGNAGWAAILSNEEYLAEWLNEHCNKLMLGACMGVLCRLPRFFSEDNLLGHITVNLAVMLRCMSPIMLLLRDDLTLPPNGPKSAAEFTHGPGLHFADASYPWPRG